MYYYYWKLTTCIYNHCFPAHSVRFEEAKSGAESVMSVADDAAAEHELLVSDWRQSPTNLRFAEPGTGRILTPDEREELDIVNMPVKRNLDAWCIAEHMDMPVLLQVLLAFI